MIPSSRSYYENLHHVLASPSVRQYEARRRETGIHKPSIVEGLPKTFPIPRCFPADTMHLELNIGQLQVSLWRGTIEHSKNDDPSTWPFTVLHNHQIWLAHGATVAATHQYIPTCVESRTPQNPAKKFSSGYKAIEYLLYVFGLCPALLYGVLPLDFYRHFCKLIFGIRIIHQRHKSQEDRPSCHSQSPSGVCLSVQASLLQTANVSVAFCTTIYSRACTPCPRAFLNWFSYRSFTMGHGMHHWKSW